MEEGRRGKEREGEGRRGKERRGEGGGEKREEGEETEGNEREEDGEVNRSGDNGAPEEHVLYNNNNCVHALSVPSQMF